MRAIVENVSRKDIVNNVMKFTAGNNANKLPELYFQK